MGINPKCRQCKQFTTCVYVNDSAEMVQWCPVWKEMENEKNVRIVKRNRVSKKD